MKNSQQRLGNKANVTLRKNINLVRRLLSHFHILYVTIWRLCQFNDLSVDIWQREGGGVNKKRVGLQILDPKRLASLLGKLGIPVRIYIHKPDVLT